MNNKTSEMIRNYAITRIFDNFDENELLKINSGTFIIPIDIDDITYFCELKFTAKKENYTPEKDLADYAVKLENAKKQLEKTNKEREKYHMNE